MFKQKKLKVGSSQSIKMQIKLEARSDTGKFKHVSLFCSPVICYAFKRPHSKIENFICQYKVKILNSISTRHKKHHHYTKKKLKKEQILVVTWLRSSLQKEEGTLPQSQASLPPYRKTPKELNCPLPNNLQNENFILKRGSIKKKKT